MDCRTGELIDYIEYQKRIRKSPEDKKFFLELENNQLTDEQKKNKKIGRNDPCPCGSGKKFKKCHYLKKDE